MKDQKPSAKDRTLVIPGVEPPKPKKPAAPPAQLLFPIALGLPSDQISIKGT